MDTYLEGVMLGVKKKNKEMHKCISIHTGRRGFIFGILRYSMILWFDLETTYFDNNEC